MTDQPTPIRIATRGSALAMWQAEFIAHELRIILDAQPESSTASTQQWTGVEIVVLSTEGDRRLDVPLSAIGGKGVFVKEVQAAVLDGRADIAVHSAKDLPAVTPDGLVVAAVPPRADPRDVLVGCSFADLRPEAIVASGSPRRRAQLAHARPDLRFAELRGNIDTRLSRLGDFDAIVMAAAALDRLGRTPEVADRLDPAVMIPQVGQGMLAVECSSENAALRELLSDLYDAEAVRAFDAERAFLERLGGDCDLPAGAFATTGPDGLITLRAVLANRSVATAEVPSTSSSTLVVERIERASSDGRSLGREVAAELLDIVGPPR